MLVTITNQAKHLLICSLNSGRTIHLAPAETSTPVEHLEINGNEKIDKLVRSGLVTVGSNDADARGEDGKGNDDTSESEDKSAAAGGRRPRKERE